MKERIYIEKISNGFIVETGDMVSDSKYFNGWTSVQDHIIKYLGSIKKDMEIKEI